MKNIWILNHYAGTTYFDKSGRHYWFAKYLKRAGYTPTIFCCNAKHGKPEVYFKGNELLFESRSQEIETDYAFIKSHVYKGNGKDRILNMICFAKNLIRAGIIYARKHGKPDIILASSVHPLTLIAGLKLAKMFKVKCICEIRDLWPYTLVQYGMLKENGLIAKILYKIERRIYRKADCLLFTMPNGAQYIKDRGWEKDIKMAKIRYINNGIDLEEYNSRINENVFKDSDLDSDYCKLVYVGAMGLPNQVNLIIEAAEELERRGINEIRILLYGDGVLRNNLEKQCQETNLKNVVFKGTINREIVPYVLSRCDATLFPIKDIGLYKYGISPNKIFEYLASGKPIITNSEILKKTISNNKCMIVNKNLTDAIVQLYRMNNESYLKTCDEAKKTVKQFDFSHLTQELINIIESYSGQDCA